MTDPVVTCNEGMVRFEGFSGCCGVYARVDLDERAFQGDLYRTGTTNVDFNNPMRAALTRLRDDEETRLAVGADEVVLSRSAESVVEKKVKLPIRWIKGFSEVQLYQPGMQLRFEVPVHEARRFIRSLPRGSAPKQPSYVSQWGPALRLSPRHKPGALRITGTDRLRVIELLLNAARAIRIYADDAHNSAWQIDFEMGVFLLMISPEIYRGFSGEGQALEHLATGNWKKALDAVQAQLAWQTTIDIDDLARITGFERHDVTAALAVLGARGLAGYDLASQAYFHRVLPFELDKVEQLQPRLKGAKKLLEENRVAVMRYLDDNTIELAVGGTGVDHIVLLGGDIAKCTCPWFSKYLGQRGPCKHILAAKMFLEKDEQLDDA